MDMFNMHQSTDLCKHVLAVTLSVSLMCYDAEKKLVKPPTPPHSLGLSHNLAPGLY